MWPFFNSGYASLLRQQGDLTAQNDPDLPPQTFHYPADDEPFLSGSHSGTSANPAGDVWGRDMGDSHTLSMPDLPLDFHARDEIQPVAPPSDSYGFMMPKSYGGQPVDERTAHTALGQGLLALGEGLMEGATSAGRGGGGAGALTGLFHGAQTGLEAYRGVLDHNRDQQRQTAEDRIRTQAAADAHAATTQEGAIRGAQFGHQQQDWKDEDTKKANTAKAATAMVSAIEQTAGVASPEAQSARALAQLGEDVDLRRLSDLHDTVIARTHIAGDTMARATAEADAKITNTPREVKAGVIEDPLAAGRRANQGLAYEGQRVAIENRREAAYETQTRKQANRDPTQEQFEGDVAAETNRLLDNSPLKERAKQAGQPDKAVLMDPARFKQWKAANPTAAIPTIQAPSLEEQQAERARAEAIARQNVVQRYRSLHTAPAAPGPDPGTFSPFSPGGTYSYDPLSGLFK